MGGQWDTDVAQISMKNCRTKVSDSALESPSLTKLVSIKFLGVVLVLGLIKDPFTIKRMLTQKASVYPGFILMSVFTS